MLKSNLRTNLNVSTLVWTIKEYNFQYYVIMCHMQLSLADGTEQVATVFLLDIIHGIYATKHKTNM